MYMHRELRERIKLLVLGVVEDIPIGSLWVSSVWAQVELR